MFSTAWYVDRLNRRLDLCRQNEMVWTDIEPGCFERAVDVRAMGTRITEAGLRYGTYGNETSIKPVFGDSEELAPWPLWEANYGPPLWSRFQPYNGFTSPQLWQYDDSKYCGINVDLSLDVEGGLWADFGNYTVLNPTQAEILILTLDGVIIGLQDEGIAKYNFGLLNDAHERIHGQPL